MKSKKSIIFVLVICLMVVMALMFVACNKKEPEPEPGPGQPSHNHTWATVWSKDATNHWYACSGCSEKKDQAAHVYTDDLDTTCNVCGYVRTLAHTHSWASEWSKDATKHWHECSGCAEKNDEAVHEYTDELDTTCNVCGYVRTLAHTHSWASEWSKNDTKHWHACSGCTEKNDEAVHVYDNDHDTTCNTCGYVRSIGDHAAATAWTTTDATHHWKACTHDGCTLKFEYGEHEYDDDHDTICDCGHVREIDPDHYDSGILDFDDTHHWTTCAHDGCTIEFNAANHSGLNTWYTDETNHWHQCGLCGYVKDQTAHVYDDNLDNICNICGYDRHTHSWASEWSSNATNHWHACSGCSEKNDEAAHVYTDDHDTTCNTCGYARSLGDHAAATAWQTNETIHWHTCTHDGCSIIFNEGEHEYDDIHDTTCNTCGYVRSIGDHVAATTWSHDADGHWHACQHDGCELKFDYEEHTADAHGFCTVCAIYMGADMFISHTNDNGLLEFGTLEAGTYYYRLRNNVSGDYTTTGTNLPNGSYVYYTRKYGNGDWQSHGDGTVQFNRGVIYTYDGDVYLVITLTEQVADCYINYCTHGSI